MRNYKMIIAYDGSRYKGWQRQNLTNLTIQTILERTVEQIVGYPVEIDGSGRTDAGVHANGQVANMKVSGLLDESFVGESTLFPGRIIRTDPSKYKIGLQDYSGDQRPRAGSGIERDKRVEGLT